MRERIRLRALRESARRHGDVLRNRSIPSFVEYSGWPYNVHMLRKLPLVFSPQPEGGFTVTSPVLPELVTEGGTLDEAYANVPDALAAVLELYAELRMSLPTW